MSSLTKTIKELSEAINLYLKTDEYDYINRMEATLKTLFDAKRVTFWHVAMRDKTFQRISQEAEEAIGFESSLLKQMIDNKKPLIENHITSNKYYNQAIDNPLELKIKALLMVPIFKGRELIGIVKIWRGIRQRKVFTKKDEDLFSSFVPLFINFFKGQEIDKEMLLSLTQEKESTPPNKTVPEKKTSKPEKREKTVSNKEALALEALQEKYESILVENRQYKEQEKDNTKAIKQLEKTVERLELKQKEEKESLLEYQKRYEALEKEYRTLKEEKDRLENNENEIVLHKKLEELERELILVQQKYNKIDSDSIELATEAQYQKELIRQLEEKNRDLKLDNESLKARCKESKNSVQNIATLKSKDRKGKSRFDIESNIESILQYFDLKIGNSESMYMLFEIMIYALSSKAGISFVEESIEKSKLIPLLLENYYFKGDIAIYHDKFLMEEMISHIKAYEKHIFNKKVSFTFDMDKKLPKSLVFDAPKLQSSILHLLFDLYHFVNHDKPIDFQFIFKEKFLFIEIGGEIHQKNSLFNTMFKQKKLGGDEKNRLNLQLSKKIIGRMKGKIDYLYENDYYKFIISLPVQVIKM